ncbi:hypothetical protein, partial [Micromonospora sp. KC721]|uniref:hypothetical protein n=1 Tax=Micromonospora sp. KC721 TaxID=2530380 RepID=UPI001A9F3CD2
MPQTFIVDQAATFQAVAFLGAEPRIEFGTRDKQETTKDGPGVPRAGGTQERAAGGPGLAAGPGAGLPGSGHPDPTRTWYYAKFASTPGQVPYGPARYYAKFASTPGQVPYGPARRAVRYGLRQLLNQVSEIDRCKRCG